MKSKNIFSENKTKKTIIKYFIISFSAFILVLAVGSVALLMNSLDYDFSNLVDNQSTTTTTPIEETEKQYSISELTGKSNILFMVENDKGLDFAFFVATDFNNKTMSVKCIDGSESFNYQNKELNLSSIYESNFETGIKTIVLDEFGILIDKYVIFNDGQFEDALSLFDGFSINVKNDVEYKSHNFNLNLSKGVQDISSDLTYKYLQISDNITRESVICDIIKSVLVEKYVSDSEKLFTLFVNLCDTDISVVDYSKSIEKLEIYCKASDKFYPVIMGE